MSNPGVIKLAHNKIGEHTIWIDDNIGESIHIHYDQFRIEMSICQFERLCDDIRNILSSMIKQIDIKKLDSRFLFSEMDILCKIESVQKKRIQLSDLQVFDDDGITYLPNSMRVKALSGIVDIDEFKKRATNYYKQSNSERLQEALKFVKKNKDIINDTGIWILEKRNLILDGWHRAACLYYLFGEQEVVVNVVHLQETPRYFREILPIEKITKKDKVVLYGAGKNGINYFNQLRRLSYNIVAWCDENAEFIGKRHGYKISKTETMRYIAFDYVIVSALDLNLQKEILTKLNEMGITEKKVIMS